MITIHLDGERMEIGEGTTLGSVLPAHPPECCVAIIRPSTKEESRTGSFAISTTAGEITLEAAGGDVTFFDIPGAITEPVPPLDRPVCRSVRPVSRRIFGLAGRPHLYERDDVILGCGGYDPKKSYLIFSKSRHSADHGADETAA